MNNFLSFTLGAAVGSAVTYILVKRKSDDFLTREWRELRKKYQPKEEPEEEIVDAVKVPVSEEKIYDKPAEDRNTIHMISPDEFGDTDYEMVTFLYEDGQIKRVRNNRGGLPVKNPERILGDSFVDWIGHYEKGVAYIRNDETETDYEVVDSLDWLDGGTDE